MEITDRVEKTLRSSGWTEPAMMALANNAAATQRMRAALNTIAHDIESGALDAAIVEHAPVCITDALNGGTYSAALEGGQGQLLLDMAAAIDIALAELMRKIIKIAAQLNIGNAQNDAIQRVIDKHSLLVAEMINMHNDNTDANMRIAIREECSRVNALLQLQVENLKEQLKIGRRYTWIMFVIIIVSGLLYVAYATIYA